VKYWLALPLLAFSAPALADWQYTKWGMSVDEVLAASQGTASKVRDKKGERVRELPRLALGKTKEGETEFIVEFFFKKKKLRLIRYVPSSDMTCAAEEQVFLDQFGPASPTVDSFEFKSRNLVLGKSRKRKWDLPGSDRLDFSVFWFERPDLPDLASKQLCVAIIQPLPATGQPS
jgi:hypothetical protein